MHGFCAWVTQHFQGPGIWVCLHDLHGVNLSECSSSLITKIWKSRCKGPLQEGSNKLPICQASCCLTTASSGLHEHAVLVSQFKGSKALPAGSVLPEHSSDEEQETSHKAVDISAVVSNALWPALHALHIMLYGERAQCTASARHAERLQRSPGKLCRAVPKCRSRVGQDMA